MEVAGEVESVDQMHNATAIKNILEELASG